MGLKDNAKRLPIDDVEEVRELMDLKIELDRYIALHGDIIQPLRDLIDRYNSLWELADKAVRAQDVTCGPFVNYSTRISIDFEKMYEELGKDDYLANGAEIVQRATYEGDQERVLRNIEAGKIPMEAAKEFAKTTRNYRRPDKYRL